jgi:hypothetical protein
MSMTENEAIKGLETLKYQCKHNGECGTCNVCCSAIPLAIQAIEEIKQYRAIGTVEELEAMKKGTLSAMELVDIWCVLEDLKKYSAIGTIEEFKALKVTQKMIEKSNFCLEQYRADTDTAYQCGYNKAIEEFVNTLIPRLTDAIYQKDVESMTNLINDVARELKAGGTICK